MGDAELNGLVIIPSGNRARRKDLRAGASTLQRVKVATALAGFASALGALAMVSAIVVGLPTGFDLRPLDVARLYSVASALLLTGTVLSPTRGAARLIVDFYFAVFCAIPATIQIDAGRFPFGGLYSDEQLRDGLVLLATGQLMFVAGYAATRRRFSGVAAPGPAPVRSEPQDEVSRMLSRLAVVFSGLGAVFASIAGPSALFTARFDAMSNPSDAEGFTLQALYVARCFALVGLLLALVSWRTSLRSKDRKPRFTSLALPLVIAAVVNFPPALPRFQLLGISLAVAVLMLDFFRARVKALFVGISTLFLLYAFSAIKDLREGLPLDKMFARDVTGYFLTVDFDSFKQTVDASIYFTSAAWRWGENFLGVVLFAIPRAVWPDKPIHTGEIVSKGLGYPFNNVASPLPAEAFASWGFFGVIVVLGGVGVITALIERGAFQAVGGERHNPSLITYALFAGYATIIFRGALNAVAPMFMTAFILAAVTAWAVRAESSPRRSSFSRDRIPTPPRSKS